MKIRGVLFVLSCLFAFNSFAVTSPNGKIKAEKCAEGIAVSYKTNGTWMPIYTAHIAGIAEGSERTIKADYQMITGKRLHCTNKGKEHVYSLQDGGLLVVRAYNDGVAFKKVARESTGSKAEVPVNISFSNVSNTWLMNWSDAYEGFFPLNREVKSGDHLAFPSLFEFNNDVFGLLTEADVKKDNAASSLYGTSTKNEFRIVTDKNDNDAKSSTWKVLILGSLSDVVESTLVTDLSTPNQLGDVSWIEPGVASWVYWAYNHGSNDFNIIKKYVDMAVELHLPYVLIDAEWDEFKDGKTVVDAVNYAIKKGIKPMIWYNSSVGWINGAPGPKFRLNKPEDREREFAWCESIGVVGVKIDFFSGDNNANMSYCIDLLESAAKHHLVVNFHGATLPRGWMRTYPNLISTEGVYGAEWYNNVPTFTKRAAAHNATLPFTRNVVGSMDYTPCAFSDSQHPHITTHAHELALTALYESGIQHLADRPESFLSQPQEVKNYLSSLPTAWDETLLLSGYPGKSVVMARRSGSTWYIAGINGTDEPQTLSFNLNRIKCTGSYITVFEDGNSKANTWRITRNANFKNSFDCKPRGGFVMVIK